MNRSILIPRPVWNGIKKDDYIVLKVTEGNTYYLKLYIDYRTQGRVIYFAAYIVRVSDKTGGDEIKACKLLLEENSKKMKKIKVTDPIIQTDL